MSGGCPDWSAWVLANLAQRPEVNRSYLQRGGQLGLPHLGQGARNNLAGEQRMRELRRGSVLDQHHGETGLSVEMGPGDQQRDLLRLAAVNRTNPEAIAIGIDVQELEAAPVPGPTDFALQIDITWATGKGFASATIDARHGAQILLSASVINLSVSYLGTSGPLVRVGASASYGTPPGGGEALLTFTEQPVIIASTAFSLPFRIPKYAARVAWFSRDDPTAFAAPDASLQFVADVAFSRVVAWVHPPQAGLIAIPNGADFIRIRNDAGLAFAYGLIYELRL